MAKETKLPALAARFFRNDAGGEPVRDWLKELPVIERKAIGEDIKTVHFGWPLGMPLVAHLGAGIWEVRARLSNRIARVLFVLDGHTGDQHERASPHDHDATRLAGCAASGR